MGLCTMYNISSDSNSMVKNYGLDKGIKITKRSIVLMFSSTIKINFFSYVSFMCAEASKIVMQYVAAVCGKGGDVDMVKEQLLQSNPVLECK